FCAEFSPDGKLFAIIGGDYVPRLWDAVTGCELHAFDKEKAVSLAFSPDGKYLAVSGWADRRPELIDLAARKVVRGFNADGSALPVVISLAFSPDSRALVTGTSGCIVQKHRQVGSTKILCAVQRWDVATGKELWHRTLVPYPVFHLAYAPGGRHLAAGT